MFHNFRFNRGVSSKKASGILSASEARNILRNVSGKPSNNFKEQKPRF